MNFMRKIFSPFCLSISLLLLVYTFYKSENSASWRSPSEDDYYTVYFIISGILILFSIITFFISQKIKEYVIIFVLSFVGSSYLLEGYLIFNEESSKEDVYYNETGNRWDKRSKIEIFNDLKKINNKIKVSFSPKYYQPLKNDPIYPLAGHSNSQTLHCNENGYYSIYQSDRYGFNNPDQEWDSKEIEYVLVGDSFTHGDCVNRPNDITSILRTLSKKSALNLGYGDHGPLMQYATLREYLNFDVKKVLWIYFSGNDLLDLKQNLKIVFLRNYIEDPTFTQNLKLKQKIIDNLAKKIIDEGIIEWEIKNKILPKEIDNNFTLKIKRFIKIFKLRSLIYSQQTQIKIPSPDPKFKEIINLAKELTNKNNAKFYFVYLPDHDHYKNQYDVTNYHLVKKIVNELNIPFIDIHEQVFKKEKNPLSFFSGHYNVEGYSKVAETIYKLTKN